MNCDVSVVYLDLRANLYSFSVVVLFLSVFFFLFVNTCGTLLNTIAVSLMVTATLRGSRVRSREKTGKDLGDRVGVTLDTAVKLSFTILAVLSLGVSRASSHRSKTDNRSGYNGEALFNVHDV